MPDINTLDLPAAKSELASYLAQEARNGARWADQDASESGLSQMACVAGRGMARLRIEILENGGAPFTVLVRADGSVAAVEPRETRFGARWFADGQWLPVSPKRASTLAAKGYREEVRMLPALVKLNASYVPFVSRAPCSIEQASAARVVP